MTTVSTPAAPPPAAAALAPAESGGSFGAHVQRYLSRIRGGDTGALPAVLGLVVLCTVFGIMRPVFLSPRNFANLFTQGAVVTIIAMGLIFVLLLGEIDLSAGFASGVCAAVLAVLMAHHGAPWYVAVSAAIVTGMFIGSVIGTLVAKLAIPSFVVTLAAFLAFQGVVLLIVDNGTNVTVADPVILAIENKNLAPWLGWSLVAVSVLALLVAQVVRRRGRLARDLPADPWSLIAARVLGLAAVLGFAAYLLNLDRGQTSVLTGVPIVVPLIGVLLLVWTFVLGRTRFGRHIYAVGGNKEAARRAGINVDRIRIAAFVICSGMAAIGGIVAASKAYSVDPNTGGSNILLNSVGAAVIGGTSLFGGRGRVMDAVLGGAVVAVIDNGMGLLGYSPGVKYVITGLVLLLAAGVDALSRRRGAATGLR